MLALTSQEAPTLHPSIPSGIDHTAWSMSDAGSDVQLKLLLQQDREYASPSCRPNVNFSIATISQHARALCSRQSRTEWTERRPRGLHRPKSSPSSSTIVAHSCLKNKHARAPSVPANVPFEELWEQDQWLENSAPIPEDLDLVSGHTMASRTAHTKSASRGEPDGVKHDEAATESQDASSGLPFELLWEMDHFQRSSHEMPQAARHADSKQIQAEAPANIPFELLWEQDQWLESSAQASHHHGFGQSGAAQMCSTSNGESDGGEHAQSHDAHHAPHTEHDVHHAGPCKDDAHVAAPANIPFELLWEQDQWLENCASQTCTADLAGSSGHSAADRSSLSAAHTSNTSRREPEQVGGEHAHNNDTSRGMGGLPLELLWETGQYERAREDSQARGAAPHAAEHCAHQHEHTAAHREHCNEDQHDHNELQGFDSEAADSEFSWQQDAEEPTSCTPMPAHPYDLISGPPSKKARVHPPHLPLDAELLSHQADCDSDPLDAPQPPASSQKRVAKPKAMSTPSPKAPPQASVARTQKRVRSIKPSAPPSVDEQEQMTRYANRRKVEIERKRMEAGRAAARMLPTLPARRSRRKGPDPAHVRWHPLPAGSEEKPAGVLRYTLLELARQLDRAGKAELKLLLAAYTDGSKDHADLAAGIQALVDTHQLTIPLPAPAPAPTRDPPSSASTAGQLHSASKLSHPCLPISGRAGALNAAPFSGMPGFYPRIMPVEMAGGKRRRKRKRGADRSASARCPVCVDCPLQDDRWVKCDGCSAWYHQVCVLYNELANGRKLRFFCRTPHCQKDKSRQLNRRYRKPRLALSPMLPETPLGAEMAARAAAVARHDRKVVVREVFRMPLEQCLAGDASPKNAEGRCECCTRRTVMAMQHTVTGSDLLFLLIFVDEHVPKSGAGRAVVQEIAANGLYEEAEEGEGLRVEAALLAAFLHNLARRGVERVESAEHAAGERSDKPLIGSAEPAEAARRAQSAWLLAVAQSDGESDGVVAELSGSVVHLSATGRVEAGAAPTKPDVDCKIMETAARLRAFLGSRQYGFGALQMAKYASMMLVYHLDQAITKSALPAAGAATRGEEEGEEGEEGEEVEEEAMEEAAEHFGDIGDSLHGDVDLWGNVKSGPPGPDQCESSQAGIPWWCFTDLKDEGLDLELPQTCTPKPGHGALAVAVASYCRSHA